MTVKVKVGDIQSYYDQGVVLYQTRIDDNTWSRISDFKQKGANYDRQNLTFLAHGFTTILVHSVMMN